MIGIEEDREREVVMYVRVDDRVTKNKKNVEIDGQLSAIQSNRQTNGKSDRGQGEYGHTDKQRDIRRNKQTDRRTSHLPMSAVVALCTGYRRSYLHTTLIGRL